MTEKEKRQQRQSAEDAVFNRMLVWLVGVIIAEAIVLLVKRFYINLDVTDQGLAIANGLRNVFSVYNWVGLVLTILGIVWCIIWAKKGKKLRLPGICTALVAVLWVVSLLAYRMYDTGVKILVVLPIAAAVLVIIFFLYQRPLFIHAILSGCGMAVLWGLRQFYSGHTGLVTVGLVAFWVLLVVVAVLGWVLKKKSGKVECLRFLSERGACTSCTITCAVVLAATLLGFVLGASVAYYLIYVLIGWLFCLAVYYTVKLM